MNIDDLQVILKVAEFRSITAAAASLDMRTATASAAVKRVEQTLGTELFVRTTRQLKLSRAGEKYLPHCEQAIQVLEQARQSLLSDQGAVDGELRLAVSSDLGRNQVIPWLDQILDAHPKLSLRVNISDSNMDFYRDSVDMALRYGSPNDASLYGFKICDVPGVLCASPAYLEQHPVPEHPHELAAHNGLFYQLQDIPYDVWTFRQGDQQFKVRMRGDRASNDGDLVRRWCVAGKGLAVKSCLDTAEDLLAGRLINVMPAFQPRITELWLICPSRQLITPAMRLLRDQLQEKCQAIILQLERQQKIPALSQHTTP